MAETHTHNDDPYAFMFDLSRISSSQDQLFHHTPFVGDNYDDTPSPDFPVASAGIVMVSPPDTQDAAQDVFHTPPEESSLHSSGVDRCAVNHAVDVDAGIQGGYSDGSEFVDLGRDSELGLSEVQLTQEIDVAECSRGARGDGVGDVFGVLERELSDLGELPVKRSKLSEQDLGFDSLGDCFGVQLQRVEEGMENCEGKLVSDADAESPCNLGEDAGKEENCFREISMDKKLGSAETQVVQLEMITSDGDVNSCESDKLACTVEGNKSIDGVLEASRMREKSDEEPVLRVLPSSIRGRLENAASELECEKGREKKKCPVFYVLKVLSENSHDVEDNLDNVSLLEVAKLRGVTFPRPRWWPDRDNFNQQE